MIIISRSIGAYIIHKLDYISNKQTGPKANKGGTLPMAPLKQGLQSFMTQPATT
jgi:hypothetical protein